MWPHFGNLLARAGVLFLHWMGTTALGFFTPVLIFVLSVVVTLGVVAYQRGMEAMRQHWKETAALTAAITLGVMLLVYGPIFLASVVNTVYDDHQELAARVVQLANAPKPVCPTCASCPTSKPCKGSVISDTPKEDKRQLRESLGKFVDRGMTIRDRCGDPGVNKAQLEADAQTWANEVVAYLKAHFDSSYVDQFRLTHTELNPSDIPAEMLPLWHGMNERVQTLDRFIDQLK